MKREMKTIAFGWANPLSDRRVTKAMVRIRPAESNHGKAPSRRRRTNMSWLWKPAFLAMFLATMAITGCTSLHDDTGWEHSGHPQTHELGDSSDIFEHRH